MIQLFTLTGLSRRCYGTLLFIFSVILLIGFALTCVTDLNHPPGIRAVRIASLGFIVLLSLIEYKCAWSGVTIFAIVWPQKLPMKVWMSQNISPLLDMMPDITAWPIAIGLTAAIAVRHLRTIPPDSHNFKTQHNSLMVQVAPLGIYLLILSTIVSSIFACNRLVNHATEWGLIRLDYRMLSGNHPLATLRPIWNALPILVNCLFALVILRTLLFEKNVAYRFRWVLMGMVLSGVIVTFQFAWQIRDNWYWYQFDESPPSGPFSNRNTLAPMLLLFTFAALASLTLFKSNFVRSTSIVLATAFVVASLLSKSRNGLVTLISGFWSLLFIGNNRLLTTFAIFLPFVLALTILIWLPFPDTTSIKNGTLKRTVQTILDIRSGKWTEATTGRTEVWSAAWRMWKQHPITGVGPGTFYIYANISPETRSDSFEKKGIPSFGAHCTPLHLLAECGPVASMSWVFLFIALPFSVILKQRKFSALSIGLLVLGLSNLLDMPWLIDGGMTLVNFLLATVIFQDTTGE